MLKVPRKTLEGLSKPGTSVFRDTIITLKLQYFSPIIFYKKNRKKEKRNKKKAKKKTTRVEKQKNSYEFFRYKSLGNIKITHGNVHSGCYAAVFFCFFFHLEGSRRVNLKMLTASLV